jgi:hypothetical protein
VNVIQRAFDDSNHAAKLASLRSDANKDDLVANLEAWCQASFVESNDSGVGGRFPNRCETWMIRTIREDIAFRHNDLFTTAPIYVKADLLICFSVPRHTTAHRV